LSKLTDKFLIFVTNNIKMKNAMKGYGAKEMMSTKAAPKSAKKVTKAAAKEKFMKMINAKKKK